MCTLYDKINTLNVLKYHIMDAILNIPNGFRLWSAYYVPVILLDTSVYNYSSKQACIFTTAIRRYFRFEATSYPANYLASYSHASEAKS